MEDNKINDIFRRFEELAAYRSIRENTWDSIIEYTDPDGGYVETEEERGELRTEHIYDSTANKDLTRLSATLNSMLTGQFTKWFQLETTDESFNKDSAGKEWLKEVTEKLLSIYNNSNFYVQVFKFYYDLCNIGTSIMYIEADTDPNKQVRFSTRHIKEMFIAEDKYGDIDTVFRKTKMTLRQIVQRWGIDNISDTSAKLYKKSPDKEIDVIHCVYPRKDYDIDQKKSTEMPYVSYWFEYSGKHLLNESGYEELPYSIARWFTPSGETYGRGPMYICIPDVRSLNRMMKITLEASELAIRPPLKGTPDLSDYQDSIDLQADKTIIYDPTRQGGLEPIWTARDVNLPFEMMQTLREQITDVLLGNQLSTIDRTQMTAAEVNARMSENAKVIGPTFGRIQSEFLEHVIERTYNIALTQVDTNGKPIIPEPPITPDGKIQIKFVSPLAKAQRSNEIQGIMSVVEWSLSVAEAFPQVLDNVDIDEAVRIFAEVQDAPPEIIKDMKVVQQLRQQRQQQQQAMMQQEQQQIQQKEQAENTNKMTGAGKNRAEAEKIDREV